MSTDTNTPLDHKAAKAQASAAKAQARAMRPFYKKKRYIALGGIAAIATFSALAGQGGASDEPTKVDQAVAAQGSGSKDAAAPKPVAVEAKVILKEFEENEAGADAKYDGKVLKVTGVINSVDTELLDDSEYVVNIGTGSDWDVWTVNADDQSQDTVASLKVGDKITVIGEFEDGGDLGVELNKSAIL